MKASTNKKSGSRSTAGPFGEPAGARTQDPNIKSVVLYLLSYGFSGTITAQTVLVVQMYGIYLKMQYPKAFFFVRSAVWILFSILPVLSSLRPHALWSLRPCQTPPITTSARDCINNRDESPTPESLKCNRMAAAAGNEAANRHKKGGTRLWQVPKVHNVARLTAPPFSRIGNEVLPFLNR